MPRDLREAARCAEGKVYVHPVSKDLVVFTSIDFYMVITQTLCWSGGRCLVTTEAGVW